MSGNETSRYKKIVEYIFFNPPFGYMPGQTELPFERKDIELAAVALGVNLPNQRGSRSACGGRNGQAYGLARR